MTTISLTDETSSVTRSNVPKSIDCDWQTSLDDLNAAVSGREELVLIVYTLIAYGFTWILGWAYVLDLQYKNSSPPLYLIGLAAFGPTISAFITMGIAHRKSAYISHHIFATCPLPDIGS